MQIEQIDDCMSDHAYRDDRKVAELYIRWKRSSQRKRMASSIPRMAHVPFQLPMNMTDICAITPVRAALVCRSLHVKKRNSANCLHLYGCIWTRELM